ncbi:substrate-binding domain-containing protein [Candidatus Mycoplasma pogonae]
MLKIRLSQSWNKFWKSGLFVIAFLSIITGIGAGIAIANRPQQKQVISLILSTRTNPFFNSIENAARKELADNNEYELNVLDSQEDDNKQTENIKNAIALNSKAIIINVINSQTAWNGGLKDAVSKNIPVIAVDRVISGDDVKINQTIASNNVLGAKDIAEWFKKTYVGSENSNVFHLEGVAGAQAAIDRKAGFEQGFGKPYWRNQIANFNRAQAIEKTGTILSSDSEAFNIIFADNDEMAVGAINAIEAKKYEAINTKPYDPKPLKYYVLGFDGTEDALKLIKEGKMAATVIQQPALMGKIAVESVLDILNGKEILNKVDAATVVVSIENIDQYLK